MSSPAEPSSRQALRQRKRHAPQERDHRGVFRFLGKILSVVLFSATALLFLVTVLLPLLLGAQSYTVLTGSMQPAYPPGTLIVVQPTSMENIRIGDVVTYQIASGRPEVITHRVIGVGVSQNGERNLTTQGDANNTPDDAVVTPIQLRGKLIYAVPWAGYVGQFLSGALWQDGEGAIAGKSIITLVLIAVIFAYGAFMIVQGFRERRGHGRRRAAEEPASEEPAQATGGTGSEEDSEQDVAQDRKERAYAGR